MPPRKRRSYSDLNTERATTRLIFEGFATRGALVVNERGDEGHLTGEVDADMVLYLHRAGGRLALPLTSFTESELYAIKEFIDIAFANAQPIVVKRDKVALEAAENGDDSYSRYYRTLPRFFVREGTKWKHRARLLRRSSWIESLDDYATVRTVNLREDRSDVPEPDAIDGVTQDDNA